MMPMCSRPQWGTVAAGVVGSSGSGRVIVIWTPSSRTGTNKIERNSTSGSTSAPNMSAHHWALARGSLDLMWT